MINKEILKKRLKEAFGDETEDTVAVKIFTTQGNVSKWLNGKGTPSISSLKEISRAYKVSVDWLLGISNEKEIDGIAIEKLTYEQAALFIDKMIELGIVEIPDLEQVARDVRSDKDYSHNPRYDSDYIKINDRLLSYMLRRRYKVYDIGEDFVDLWKDNSLPVFRGLRLLKYSKEIEKLMDSQNWTSFKDGDWVALVNSIADMTQDEVLIELNRIEKGRKNDGD